MTARAPQAYRSVAEAAWAWVLAQVQWSDGPWVPTSVPVDEPESGPPPEPPADRDGLHSGIGGLAHALAEIRLTRPWTGPEQDLAAAIVTRIRTSVPAETDVTYFDGLASAIGVLVALGPTAEATAGLGEAVDRLAELAQPDGWPQTAIGGPRYATGARVNDLTLGTGGVLVGALWAHRHGAPRARALAEQAADVLLAEAVPRADGTDWRFVPERFHVGEAVEMPNLSHGLAGIVAALAAAGRELGRPDLVAAARSGAEHLVGLADRSDGGFVVPRTIPLSPPDADPVTYTWCHGPTGTSVAFLALERAGVADVAGARPVEWQRRCLHSVRTSGVPARVYPGFWDNDGRCCGTAGVGDVFLDSWQRAGEPDDLEFALELADTLVERAVRAGPHAYWRFVEHRNDPPLLPPGVGWMQGATGIAAYLFRVSRVLSDPSRVVALPRMDTWWALPYSSSAG